MTALIYPTPPPTSNTLDATQRTRLLRSARKLGLVLGTTPCLVDAAPPVPPTPRTKARRRAGRVFTPSPDISDSEPTWDEHPAVFAGLEVPLPPLAVTLSVEDRTDAKPAAKAASKQPLARPLLLRLRAIPTAPIHTKPASISRPRSHTHSQPRVPTPPPTPLSPTPTTDNVHDARRRKMAKLTRTFGEANIPPELVFSTAPTPAPSPEPVLPNVSRPLPTPPASILELTPAPGPTLAERRHRPRPRSLSLAPPQRSMPAPKPQPKNPAPSARTITQPPPSLEALYVPPIPPSNPSTTAPLSLRDIYTPPPRTCSLPKPPGTPGATPRTHRSARSVPTEIVSSPRAVAQGHVRRQTETHVQAHTDTQTAFAGIALVASRDGVQGEEKSKERKREAKGHRREREWSGEWNCEMDEVVRRLRRLGC